jgi:hypothetical protein
MCFKKKISNPTPMCLCASQLAAIVAALTPIPKKIGLFYQEDTTGTKVFAANTLYSISIAGLADCTAKIFLDGAELGVLVEGQTTGWASETLITEEIKIVSTSGNYQANYTKPI